MSESTEKCDVDLSEEGLAAIERRAREATPGPWERLGGGGRASALVSTVDESGPDLAEVFGPHEPPNANADFIAAARTDVPALVAEVRRLRKRDRNWQRATRCDEPEQVHERTVRLCSCDGAILPQIGDEVDTCWECDGLVKVTENDELIDAPATDGAAS